MKPQEKQAVLSELRNLGHRNTNGKDRNQQKCTLLPKTLKRIVEQHCFTLDIPFSTWNRDLILAALGFTNKEREEFYRRYWNK